MQMVYFEPRLWNEENCVYSIKPQNQKIYSSNFFKGTQFHFISCKHLYLHLYIVHVCLYNNQVGSSHCLGSLMVKTLGPFLGYSGWHWQGELEETN